MGILRFLLAVIVVLYHVHGFTPITITSDLSVQTFYIISGFYMTMILNEKYRGKGSYKLFISNRFLRIYPVYWVMLILIVVYSVGYMSFSRSGSAGPFFDPYIHYFDDMSGFSFISLILSNILIFFQDVVMFLGLNTETGNFFFTPNFRETDPQLYNFLLVPQAWTVGLELTFYLIAPLIVRRKLPVILSMITASILLRVFLINSGYAEDPWSYRFFPTELALFLLGCISYKIYIKQKDKELNKNLLAGILVLMLIFTLTHRLIDFDYKHILYIGVATVAIPFIFILTKRSKIDRQIGELSYPIYICHMFIIQTLPNIPVDWGSSMTKAVFVVLMSILLSYMLNKFVAQPIEKIRAKRIQK